MRGLLETRVRGLEKATGQGERHTIFFVEVGPECERQAAAYPKAGLVCVLTNARVR